MVTLQSIDKVQIAGVGESTIFAGVDGLNPRTLQGQRVMVDGVEQLVKRVGTYAVMDPTGMAFELLLAPVEPDS